ncbi:hypothetical protein BDN72DRAFT_827027 [Pluteus cervinus]|uniref:Uncharacterized protein n=1 Tax=Pluteus cervinus TaxID=181527 RepID=A0ACD3ABA4_9AGAR|nr:hypothetical protein BDN72DRAFT_827027 [Pluteus cervinus]
MSQRKPAQHHTLPANPTYVEFPRTDGNQALWPTHTTKIVDSDGQVNFMLHLGLDSPISIKWRVQVGKAVALDMNMPEGTYVLKDWPPGYRMFDHHKGPERGPRHDVYLFGSPKGKFRSINEFIPHAIWLMHNDAHASCLCKYCSKKTQKEITANLGILASTPGPSSPVPSRGPRLPREKEKEKKPREAFIQREPQYYTSVQRVPKPVQLPQPPGTPKPAMVVERNADLRAVSSKTSMVLRRWFRDGELLWCAIKPIHDPLSGLSITLWPGIVNNFRLHSDVVRKPSPVENEAEPVVPWSVKQSTVYKIQLLAVAHIIDAADHEVLPYQAHVLSAELLDALQTPPATSFNLNRGDLQKFNPYPDGDEVPAFSDAVAPYAMAVEIASTLSSYWSLTDDWHFHYSVKPPKPRPSASSLAHIQGSQPQTLQAALEAAAQHNASTGSSSARLNGGSASTSALASQPQPEKEKEKMTTTAATRSAGGSGDEQVVTQARFQGLWWGTERIWTDELIRLKVPRRCLAPKGAENIYPPSGPGKSAKESWEKRGRDSAELGAGTRSMFMRLDGLFIADIPQPEGGVRKECRASGMLYELADLDWDDPDVQDGDEKVADGQPSSSSKAATPSAASATSRPADRPNGQLSEPGIPFPLPDAPQGYRFRPILTPSHEAVMSLSLISGRYYPRILSHPLLDEIVEQALTNPLESGGLLKSSHLWALEGLSAGYYNSVDPTYYRPDRFKMVEDADKSAHTSLEAHKQRRLELNLKQEVDELEMGAESASAPPQHFAMEVDVH